MSLATASGMSPSSSVEFSHGSGSSRVLDATYFCVLLSTSVNGFGSVWCGQKAAKCSYVRRPSSRDPASAMPSAITAPITSSP